MTRDELWSATLDALREPGAVAVRHQPGRRDRVGLHPAWLADVERPRPLFTAALGRRG